MPPEQPCTASVNPALGADAKPERHPPSTHSLSQVSQESQPESQVSHTAMAQQSTVVEEQGPAYLRMPMILRPSRSCTISSLSSSSTRAVPTHRIHDLAAPQPDSSSRRQASIAVRLHGSTFLQRHKLQAARHALRRCNLCCASQRTTQWSGARGLSGFTPGGGTSSIAVARAPTCAGLRWSPAQQCTHGPAPQPAGGRKLHTVPDENLARAEPAGCALSRSPSYKDQLLRII